MAFLRTIPRAIPRALPSARTYHTTPYLRLPYKDDQDRESLKPRANESTRSTSDDAVAESDVAFDPKTTRPESEQGSEAGDQLEASPTNQEFNKPRGDETSKNDRGLGQEVRKGGASKTTSSQKKGGKPE